MSQPDAQAMKIPTVERFSFKGPWADRFGVVLSSVCAVHCILTPVVFLLLPSLHLAEFHESFHHTLLVILPLLALVAFVPGYRGHRDLRVFMWAFPGFALILASAFFFEHSHELMPTVLSVAGSISLVRAHLLNRHLSVCGHGCRH